MGPPNVLARSANDAPPADAPPAPTTPWKLAPPQRSMRSTSASSIYSPELPVTPTGDGFGAAARLTPLKQFLADFEGKQRTAQEWQQQSPGWATFDSVALEPEISVAPAPAASSSGGKLQWQRIINQPLKLKASVDYDEARHRVIREDTDLQRRLGLEVHVIPKQVHGASLQLVLPVQHHVAVVAELARRVPALEFAEPPLGFWEKVFARAAAAGRRHQP